MLIPRFRGKVNEVAGGFDFTIWVCLGDEDPIEMSFKEVIPTHDAAMAKLRTTVLEVLHKTCEVMGVEPTHILDLKEGRSRSFSDFRDGGPCH